MALSFILRLGNPCGNQCHITVEDKNAMSRNEIAIAVWSRDEPKSRSLASSLRDTEFGPLWLGSMQDLPDNELSISNKIQYEP